MMRPIGLYYHAKIHRFPEKNVQNPKFVTFNPLDIQLKIFVILPALSLFLLFPPPNFMQSFKKLIRSGFRYIQRRNGDY